MDDEELRKAEIEKVRREIRTVQKQVAYILANYPRAREDDQYLYIMVLRIFYPQVAQYLKYIPFDILRQMPALETVTRCRRKLWEKGLYLPENQAVLRKRRRREKAFRKVMPQE
jgi:hypothetical protein